MFRLTRSASETPPKATDENPTAATAAEPDPKAEAAAALEANHRFLNRHVLGPPLHIDVDATPDQMAGLVARIEENWRRFGETEPYWSVIANPAFRAQRIEETRADFFRTGEQTVERVEAALARAAIRLPEDARILDYGCGVGRVSAAFARRGYRVTGVDISAEHLALAAEHCQGLPVDLVRIERLAEIDTLPECDLFFSTIVLQHNPPPVIAEILARALHRVAPGGAAWFQVPTYLTGYRYDLEQDLAATEAGQMELHVLPQAAVFDRLAAAGFVPREIRFNNAVGNAACESSVFVATRSAVRPPAPETEPR
ncbi:MAG: class I SAM-dependent methyltransferase [Paracoccaceae bacterium]